VARLRKKRKSVTRDKWFNRIENAINYCGMEMKSSGEQAKFESP
jgi:hypothetical protein